MIKSLIKPALLSAALVSGAAMAADYDIDPAHSAVLFKINHMGFSETVGRFDTFSGNYSYDESNPAASNVNVTINADSLNTNHDARDKHVKSPDFLDTKQYPEITFTSNGYKGSATEGILSGELTLHGVTKKIDLNLVKVGEGKDPWGGYRSGFNGTITLKREDFGVDMMLGGIGNDVKIELFIEGTRK